MMNRQILATILILGLIGLAWGTNERGNYVQASGVEQPFDLIVLWDVSDSQSALDPNSLARQTINLIVDYLQVSLNGYSDSRLAIIPFRFNTDTTQSFVPIADATVPESFDNLSDGTNFVAALQTAETMFSDENAGQQDRRRVVMLITDGEPDVGSPDTIRFDVNHNLEYLQTTVGPLITESTTSTAFDFWVVSVGRNFYEEFWNSGEYGYVAVDASEDLFGVYETLATISGLPAAVHQSMPESGRITFTLTQGQFFIFFPAGLSTQTNGQLTLYREGSDQAFITLGADQPFYYLNNLLDGNWEITFSRSGGEIVYGSLLLPTTTPTVTNTFTPTATATNTATPTNTPTTTPTATPTYTSTPLPTLGLEFSDWSTFPVAPQHEAITFTLFITSSIPYTVTAYRLPGEKFLGTYFIEAGPNKLVVPVDNFRCNQIYPWFNSCGQQIIKLVGNGNNLGQPIIWNISDYIIVSREPLLERPKQTSFWFWLSFLILVLLLLFVVINRKKIKFRIWDFLLKKSETETLLPLKQYQPTLKKNVIFYLRSLSTRQEHELTKNISELFDLIIQVKDYKTPPNASQDGDVNQAAEALIKIINKVNTNSMDNAIHAIIELANSDKSVNETAAAKALEELKRNNSGSLLEIDKRLRDAGVPMRILQVLTKKETEK